MHREIFFISDSTGITAETLGHSLITQFEKIEFETTTIPYIDTKEKAQQAVQQINKVYQQNQQKPLIFATLVNPKIHEIIATSQGMLIDFFRTFIDPLESELGLKSSFTIGKSHSMVDFEAYKNRIDAVNYTLAHDDGIRINNYGQADLVLVGVSRSGKTPTSLYLALQFGILTANYPFTEDDLQTQNLPAAIQPHKDKLFGLHIDAKRLQAIRNERLPQSQYASLRQCQREVNEIVALYQRENIPYLNSTHHSIEEISTKILAITGLERKTF
ncbi:MAG: pyruvate, water dikinase regulatory protein [Gammaproteobacteria bacterium]